MEVYLNRKESSFRHINEVSLKSQFFLPYQLVSWLHCQRANIPIKRSRKFVYAYECYDIALTKQTNKDLSQTETTLNDYI